MRRSLAVLGCLVALAVGGAAVAQEGEGPTAAERAAEKRAKADRERRIELLAERHVEAVIGDLRRRLAAGQAAYVENELWYLMRGRHLPETDFWQPAGKDGKGKKSGPKSAEEKQLARLTREARDLAMDRVKAAANLLQGDLHMAGQGTVRNFSLARTHYLTAAEAGNAEAAYRLGLQFENGFGVPVDWKEAVSWYGKAAEMGHGPAAMLLGRAYAAGRLDRRPDPMEAERWLAQALENGVEDAADLLDRVRLRGVPLDPPAERRRMPEGWPRQAGEVREGPREASLKRVEPDHRLQALVRRYVEAVNDDDLAALKDLFAPQSLACVNVRTRAYYEDLMRARLDGRLPERDSYPLEVLAIGPRGALPFAETLDYQMRPSHQIEVTFDPEGDGTRRLVSAVTFQVDGTWAFVFPCLDREVLAAEGVPIMVHAGLPSEDTRAAAPGPLPLPADGASPPAAKAPVRVPEEASEAASEGEVTATLQMAAARLRKTLPKEVDDRTRLTEVAVIGQTLRYTYRVDVRAAEIDTEKLRESLRRKVRRQVCLSRDLTGLLEKGAAYEYFYMDQLGDLLAELRVTAFDCDEFEMEMEQEAQEKAAAAE